MITNYRPDFITLYKNAGVGIAEEKIGSVFSAFAQLQDGQTTGTGLGLYGVRMRAEGLQGCCGARQNLHSPTGTGTVMWFSLPYVVDSNSTSNTPRQLFQQSDLESPPGRNTNSLSTSEALVALPPPSPITPLMPVFSSAGIAQPEQLDPGTEAMVALIRKHKLVAIVVDDTLTVRKLMQKMLLQMGFARVDCYENGSKGLDVMLKYTVDIVFSDVQMPIMSGPEVRLVLCLLFLTGNNVIVPLLLQQ